MVRTLLTALIGVLTVFSQDLGQEKLEKMRELQAKSEDGIIQMKSVKYQ